MSRGFILLQQYSHVTTRIVGFAFEITDILHDNSDQPCWNHAIHPVMQTMLINRLINVVAD